MMSSGVSATLRAGMLYACGLLSLAGTAVAQEAARSLSYSVPQGDQAVLGTALDFDPATDREQAANATLHVTWVGGEAEIPLDVQSLAHDGRVAFDVPLAGASGNGQVRWQVEGLEGETAEAEIDYVTEVQGARFALEVATTGASRGGRIVLHSSRPLAELPLARDFRLLPSDGSRVPHVNVRQLDAYRLEIVTAEAVAEDLGYTLVFNGGGEDVFGLALPRFQLPLEYWDEADATEVAPETLAATGPIAAAEVTIPLSLTETPANSGILTAFATGSFNSGGKDEARNYQIELEAGDQLSVYTNAIEASPPTARLQLYDPSGDQLLGGYNGSPDPIQRYAITTPGTYRVRFWMGAATDFEFRVDVGRGESLEAEQNNGIGQANTLRFSSISGGYQAQIAGALANLDSNPWFSGSNDTHGDFFSLGTINAGNSIDVTYAFPMDSTLATGDVELSLFRSGQTEPVTVSTTGSGLSFTATADDAYYLQVGINDNLDGTSLSFSGGSDRADLPAAVLNGRNTMTIEFWMRGVADGRSVLSAAQSSQYNEVLFWIQNGDTFQITDRGSSHNFTVPEIDGATWRHYAIVRDASAGTLELFVDGVSMGSQSVSLSPLTVESLVLGQEQDAVAGGYDPNQAHIGDIDDLRVWSVARTATEIADNQKVVLDGDEPGLIGYWRFNEGSGTTIYDETANNYDGTLSGAVFAGDTSAAGFNPAKLGLHAQYVSTFTVSDTIAPSVVGTSLPDPSNSDYYVSFTVDFSEDMAPLTVEDAAHYTLVEAGEDDTFGTADDAPYAIAVSPYSNGTQATLLLTDGPLQPGRYRFEADSGLTDRAGNALTPFAQEFTVTQLGDFFIESRSNGSFASATPLADPIDPAHDGSFSESSSIPGGNAEALELIDLNEDGHLDVLLLDSAPDVIRVFLSDGAGTLTEDATYSTADEPYYSTLGDFNDDGRMDIAVSVRDDDVVHVYLNQGDGTLADAGTTAVGDGPLQLVADDFDGDTVDDLAVANNYAGTLTILLNDGSGTFSSQEIAGLGSGTEPFGIASGLFDGDSQVDLAFTDYENDRLGILSGHGDGTFAAVTYQALDPDRGSVEALRAADLDGDGSTDLVATFYNGYSEGPSGIFFSQGDGTFAAPYDLNSGSYQKSLELADINGDGHLDFLIGSRYNFRYYVGTGDRTAPVAGSVVYEAYDDAYAMGATDVNGDGRTDLLLARQDDDRLYTLAGNPSITPLADTGIGGLRQALGRGNVSDEDDEDYFVFSAEAGDRLSVVVDSMIDNGNDTGLRYEIYDVSGNQKERVYGDRYTGRGQSAPVYLGAGGTFYVHVYDYYDYYDEYRFRLSLADEAFQLESENNDSINNADALNLSIDNGALRAKVLGQATVDDDDGDYFSLGNYADGATITLTFTNGEDSSLNPKLWIYTSDDVVRKEGAVGETTISYTVTSGTEGAYYARVRGEDGTRDFFGEYQLEVAVSDSEPLQITGDTLPTEGTTVSTMINGFNLTVSEDLEPSTVNDVAHYDVRSSGPDGSFGTADDAVYAVQNPGYSSGNTIAVNLVDGPIQAGDIRVTIPAGSLADRFGNGLVDNYIRTFTITGLDPYVTESRSNDTLTTADSLSPNPNADHAGSFTALASGTIDAGNDARRMAQGDFNGDNHVDLAVASSDPQALLIFLGNGDGSFAAPVSYPFANNPFDVQVADFNGDNEPDLAVSLYDTDSSTTETVAVLLNDGSGGFADQTQYDAGDSVRSLTIGDWNDDTHPDIAVANYGYYSSTIGSVTLLLNDGSGAFTGSTIGASAGAKPFGIVSGDFDGDGVDDLAFGDRYEERLGVWINEGAGAFTNAITWFALPDEPLDLDAGDLDADGSLDLVVGLENNDQVAFFRGDGAGDFADYASINLNNSDAWVVRLADVNDDGSLDIVTGGNEGLSYRAAHPDGSGSLGLEGRAQFDPDTGDTIYGLAFADFNEDGRSDIAASDLSDGKFYLYLGDSSQPLPEVNPISGLREAYFRGRGPTDEDEDYFVFTAEAGDNVTISGINLDPAYYSHYIYLYNFAGDSLESVSLYYGDGELSYNSLPYTGRYYVRVRANNGHTDEYRIRLSLLPHDLPIESESNSGYSSSDPLTFTEQPGVREAQIFANYGDSDNSDYFEIGNLAAGATVTLELQQPDDSPLTPTLKLYGENERATKTSGAEGETTLSYTLVEGEEDLYHAVVEGDSSSKDLFSRYKLTVTVSDTVSPEITSISLADEGETTGRFIVGIDLGFSEDLDSSTVTDPTAYDLRSAGPDTDFGTADDTVYSFLAPSYTSGPEAYLPIVEEPLPEGHYRFTIAADNLKDLFGNPLEQDFVRTFHVEGVQDMFSESGSNDTIEEADLLADSSSESPDGSYTLVTSIAAGANVDAVALLDADDDGDLDLVGGRGSSTTPLGLWLNDGGGNFSGPTAIATFNSSNEVREIVTGLFDDDALTDFAVSLNGSDTVRVYGNNGDGTFTELARLSEGDPDELAVADLDDDGDLDLVAELNTAPDAVGVWLNDGAGGFSGGKLEGFPTNTSLQGVALARVDGDAYPDLLTVDDYNETLQLRLGDGAGGFAAATTFALSDTDASTVAAGDFNADGAADVVVGFDYNTLADLFVGAGDGTFTRRGLDVAGGEYVQNFLVTDVDGDGVDDLVASTSRYYGFLLYYGLTYGNEILTEAAAYEQAEDARATAVGDLDGDGYAEIVVADSDEDRFAIFEGRRSVTLQNDSEVPGLRYAMARGTSRTGDGTSDDDFWTFSALPGDRYFVSAQNTDPSPYYTDANYYLFGPGGVQLDYFGTRHYGGEGQNDPYTIGSRGRFFVQVSDSNPDGDEYRFVLNLLPAPVQTEDESNDSTSNAMAPTFAAEAGSKTATVFGNVDRDDDQDYYLLGNLAPGTQIKVALTLPNYSLLDPRMMIYREGEAALVTSDQGDTLLQATVPAGEGGAYYVNVMAGGDTGSFRSTYLAELELLDNAAPEILGTTLPSSGDGFISTFDLTLSEDFDPEAVNDVDTYDLRYAGTDGTFDTADDVELALEVESYSSGATVTLNILDEPLRPGLYRFRAGGDLQDLYGNPLPAAYEETFTVDQVSGFTTEAPNNGTAATATAIGLAAGDAGHVSGGLRGRISDSGDVDYWQFDASTGQTLIVDVDHPGSPNYSELDITIDHPDGSTLYSFRSPNDGTFATSGPQTLSQTGTYTIRVDAYDSYYDEYRLRVTLLDSGRAFEQEANNSVNTANALNLASDGSSRSGTIFGLVKDSADLDYFSLGTVNSGESIFLTANTPASSSLVPSVAVYDSNGVFVGEISGGRSGDAVAQVDVTTTGDYFALVRASAQTGGLMSEYALQAEVAPSDTTPYANLQVESVTIPGASGILSGDTVNFSFSVRNLGNSEASTPPWRDRVVISQNAVFGDGDDRELAAFDRATGLTAGTNYSVSGSAELPDGIQGDFFLIVKTDVADAVDEFVFEGDNVTASSSAFHVDRADYPDLEVQSLAVSIASPGAAPEVTWTTANVGNADAIGGLSERIQVFDRDSGNLVQDASLMINQDLSAGGSVSRSFTLDAPAQGHYRVYVTTDADDDFYEYGSADHATAEDNVADADFTVYRYFHLDVAAQPTDGGSVTGAGTYREGESVSLDATPDTSSLPYTFSRWTKVTGELLSTRPDYTFTPTQDLSLVAHFTLPSYAVTVSKTLPEGGVVTGGGSYSHGSTATLTAAPKPGYLFSGWQENGSGIGSATTLDLTVTGTRSITAVFEEENPTHDVTVNTQPGGIVSLGGSGTYSNGDTLNLSAPATEVDGETEYLFQQWNLNGVRYSTSGTASDTFTTLDDATLTYTAVYSSRSFLPVVSDATPSVDTTTPVTAGDDFRVTLVFDRAMDTGTAPVVSLSSSDAAAVPSFPTGGSWTADHTWQSAVLNFGPDHTGTYTLSVSAATDTQGRTMDPADVLTFQVDTAPPAAPNPTLGTTTESSAQLLWDSYTAPADLQGFRLYLDTSDFSTVDPADAATAVGSGVSAHIFTGLELDTPYYAAVVAVDQAGNFGPAVSTVSFTLASDVPPPVTVTTSDYTPDGFTLDWSGYDTSALFGFAGFHVYRAESDFSDVSALTPVATLAPGEDSYTVSGLDRTQDFYFAVVGFNRLDEQNPNVTTVSWSDPLSGAVTADRSFGGAGVTVEVLQPVTVQNGATLTIEPGTTLYFAPGAGIAVQDGVLDAAGTALQPIVLTSAHDRDGASTPAQPGDWTGVQLQDAGQASNLSYVWIAYGEGLRITGAAPTTGPLALVRNAGAGLSVANGAALTASDVYLAFNDVGLTVDGSGSSATLSNSVLKNNGTAAATANGGGTLTAQGNWWGTSDPSAIASMTGGMVDAGSPLAEEPLLGTGFGLKDGITQTTNGTVTLRIASFNASAYRTSEDSTFTDVLYEDVRAADAVDPYSPQPWEQSFTLSAGAGRKTLHLELLSPTGGATDTASVSLDVLGDGPTIQGFSLSEGDVLHRPVIVTATTTAPLGVDSVTFYVDDAVQAQISGSALSERWNISALTSGIYRVRLEARDAEGNLAVRELNVTVDPQPAPAPTITAPTDGTGLTVDTVDVSGTAEPMVGVRLLRNGAVVATGAADASGDFTFADVPLSEGNNNLVAVAFDAAGSASSSTVQVVSDTMGPVAVEIEEPVYDPDTGLLIQWRYTDEEGERPVRYEVFWDTNPFADVADAANSSGILEEMSFSLENRPDQHYYFRVVGYDAAGNASTPTAAVEATLDETAPVIKVFYDAAMPVGPGGLGLTIRSNEPLMETPTLTIQPKDMRSPISVPLTADGGQAYTGTFPVNDASTNSGDARVVVSARDLEGNRFTGAPTGETLAFDVTRPKGELRLNMEQPIQVLSTQVVQLTLELSEIAETGTVPSLSYSPPSGADVDIALTDSGDGRIFTGQLTLFPSMGRGEGLFLMEVDDAQGNTGTVLTTGETLEIYNTQLPTAPSVPQALVGQTLSGGRIRLVWPETEKARTYSLYRVPASQSGVPNQLVAEGITETEYTDLPPTDGSYRYAVTALRLGAESGASPTASALSDRTAPAAPQNAQATLGYSGVEITFDAPAGEPAPHHWVLYRNGDVIKSFSPALRSITDTPPRGQMAYQIAASDAYENHALSNTATIEMYVGAVRDLAADVSQQGAVSLSWTNTDNEATGYNVYRNGVLQTETPITSASYADPLSLPDRAVTYAVTAVNDENRESVARQLVVQPLSLALTVNPDSAGEEQSSYVGFFDNYRIAFDNAGGNAALDFSEVRVRRDVGGNVLIQTCPLSQNVASGAAEQADVAVPAPGASQSAQDIRLRLKTEPAEDGSYLSYQLNHTVDLPIQRAQNAIELNPSSRPLAGGLTDFELTVKNLGYATAQFLLVRDNGAKPGDLEISVRTDAGQEVSATEFRQLVPGLTFNGAKEGLLVLDPGESKTFTFEDVFVPASLADASSARFVAEIDPIWNSRGATGERASGPIRGSTTATPRETPYYGTASTARAIYSDDETITITGQALDRNTDQPMPNTALRIGFNVQGFVFYEDVTTDASGDYSFDYEATPGVAGAIKIWAAHPEVVDELEQASVMLYRSFLSPARGDIRMSKSDTLDFQITLINPGDVPLENVTMSTRAYVVNEDDSETDITSLDAILREPLPTRIPASGRVPVKLQLQSTLDAPDDAVIEITLTSAEGASSTFTGYVSLLPAIPILSVQKPDVGYVDLTVDRGDLKSRQVTIVNEGLRPLEDVVLTPPQNLDWMHVNLPVNDQGKAELEDIPVGGKFTFTVVYTPPSDVEIGYHDDVVTISGSNAVSDFELGLYAQVSSSETGSVRFSIDNTLVQPLPNATVRLRNLALGLNKGPYKTDANGEVLVEDLQEGKWTWQVSAPSHNTTGGTVEVIPDQTVLVDQRLYKSLVSVKFSVVPKPFTDRYEIKIEQTFETRVPAPVLYLDPPQYSFDNPPDGFETTVIFTLHNDGLISVFDVTVEGMQMDWGRLEPLVTYLPELGAQESVQLPFRFKIYDGDEASPARALMRASAIRASGASDFASCFLGIPMSADEDLARGMAALVKAGWECADGDTAAHALSAMILANSILNAPVHVADAPFAYLARALGCAANFFSNGGGGGGGGGSGPSTSGGSSYATQGSGCFLPDTPVRMADGSARPIGNIAIGDRVASGPGTDAEVLDVIELRKDDVYAITYQGEDGRAGQLLATAEHNIWVDGKDWVAVASLETGDWLHRADGALVRITSIEPVDGEHTVYTLLLDEDSAFYANDILVQDSCGNYSQLNQAALQEGGLTE
ncbi:MAG: fibronectin type III domain-containing protein [Puniceicoccaceae bacterium 5H]|nr:MAG: fibronectin type III domain-containing protein [Puniceicoccaceae bacterium 5H]